MTSNHYKSLSSYSPVGSDDFFLDDEKLNEASTRRQRKSLCKLPLSALIHTGLVLFYTATACFIIRYVTQRDYRGWPHLVPSPGYQGFEYERQTFHAQLNDTNVYRGTPRPALDEAWQELLIGMNTRVPKDALDRLGRTSIKIDNDTEDYYGMFDVFHQLHCLRKIRHYVTKDYYPDEDDFLPAPGEAINEHIDHCIDSIRQYIMCNADVSMITFSWLPHWPIPLPNFEVDHQCVDWKRFKEWVGERAFNMEDLRHPELDRVGDVA